MLCFTIPVLFMHIRLVEHLQLRVYYYYYWSLLYSTILRSRADSLPSHVILHEWFFIARFWISTQVLYLQHWHGWCHMKLLPSWRILCTPYNHAPCHFMQSHVRKVHACLAVTCYLHLWQNEWDLLHATAITWGWNGYPNKSHHRKLTQEKIFFMPLLQGLEPATFDSQIWRSNQSYPCGAIFWSYFIWLFVIHSVQLIFFLFFFSLFLSCLNIILALPFQCWKELCLCDV